MDLECIIQLKKGRLLDTISVKNETERMTTEFLPRRTKLCVHTHVCTHIRIQYLGCDDEHLTMLTPLTS